MKSIILLLILNVSRSFKIPIFPFYMNKYNKFENNDEHYDDEELIKEIEEEFDIYKESLKSKYNKNQLQNDNYFAKPYNEFETNNVKISYYSQPRKKN